MFYFFNHGGILFQFPMLMNQITMISVYVVAMHEKSEQVKEYAEKSKFKKTIKW